MRIRPRHPGGRQRAPRRDSVGGGLVVETLGSRAKRVEADPLGQQDAAGPTAAEADDGSEIENHYFTPPVAPRSSGSS